MGACGVCVIQKRVLKAIHQAHLGGVWPNLHLTEPSGKLRFCPVFHPTPPPEVHRTPDQFLVTSPSFFFFF